MLEEVKRKEVDKRDKQLPQNFEQLIQMYDLDKLWSYMGKMTEYINNIYPVGSVYISINDINPSSLFGGTWEQIEDMFLLASGSIYSAGSTGGEAMHTLTTDEMPSHNHTLNNANGIEWVGGNDGGIAYAYSQSEYSTNAWADTSLTASNTGGGQAHNNMPPYLAVYIWKRIS